MMDDPMMPMPAGKTAPCNRACRYAYPGEEAVYCVKHKMTGMVDVVNPSCKVGNVVLLNCRTYQIFVYSEKSRT